MEDKQIININGKEYILELEATHYVEEENNEIRCPNCFNNKFQISYDSYECFAHCVCGNSFVIYDR